MEWVVKATPQSLYPGKRNRRPFYEKLGGPQDRSERMQKNLQGYRKTKFVITNDGCLIPTRTEDR